MSLPGARATKPASSPAMTALSRRDLLGLTEMTRADVGAILDAARRFKKDRGAFAGALGGKAVALIFEKPSLRTRVSFEAAVRALGGHPVSLDHSKQRLGERESVKDEARTLSRYVHAAAARVFSHAALAAFASHADMPVVNALSDREHPCQALADFMTLEERLGRLEGARLCYLGDGNNVCRSLIAGAALLGVRLTVITPPGHAPDAEIIAFARAHGPRSGGALIVTTDPAAAEGHDAVYTDTWTSMGDESSDGASRRAAFMPYQVNAALMRRASAGRAGGAPALFMHCLPAHRGLEVTDEVIDSPASVVYDQAENRLHAQAALLALLSPRMRPV